MKNIEEKDLFKWANILIEPEFLDKHIIVDQINRSKMYVKESYVDACFAGFKIAGEVKRYPHNVQVPIEMSIFRRTGIPIDFLLFLSDGVVFEMEIADYDFLELDPLNFDFSKREYRVSEKVRI